MRGTLAGTSLITGSSRDLDETKETEMEEEDQQEMFVPNEMAAIQREGKHIN